MGLERVANAFDQEGTATLVMSGHYLGHLPDHYARSFVEAGAYSRPGDRGVLLPL